MIRLPKCHPSNAWIYHARIIVLLAAVLVAASSCRHHDKAEQLAALDSAYQAGLLTKDEYDAKKLALTGSAAVSAPAIPPVTTSASPSPLAPVAAFTEPPVIKHPIKPVHTLPTRQSSAEQVAPPVASSVTASTAPATAAPGNVAPNIVAPANEPKPMVGCDDAERKSGGQKGPEERFFAAPPEAVRRAARSVLDSMDFSIREDGKDEIEASKNRHAGAIVGAGGERVKLTFKKFEQEGQSGTRVIGETKKNFIGHIAQKTWTDAVFAQMACALHISGR